MKYLKVIAGVFATILLGAIGSGLWERILSPVLDSISRKAILFVDGIYSGYLDSIYRSAAFDLPNIYQQKIAALLLIIVGLFWGVSIATKYDWRSMLSKLFPATSTNVIHAIRVYFLIVALSLLVMGMFLLSKADYVQKTILYSCRSLEILHPYIGEEKYLILKSEYHQVDSAKAFERFNSKLIALSKENKVSLPEFKVID